MRKHISDNVASEKNNLTSYKNYEILNLLYGSVNSVRVMTLENTKKSSSLGKNRKLRFLIISIAVLLVATVVGCPFYRIIGIPCPCCGVTRAWIAFAQGDIKLAFAYHGLFPIVPFIGVAYVVQDKMNGKPRRWLGVLLYIMAIAVFAYAVLRWLGYVVMP